MEDQEDVLTDDLAAGAVSLIPFVGPVIAPFAKRLSGKIREEWQRNSSIAMRAAERVSGMSREQLMDAISDDPRLLPLVTRVLFEAGRTGQDKILVALGTALGDAVRDPSNIDEAELLLIGMANLRGHHITVLEALSENPPQDAESGRQLSWHPTSIAERTGYRLELVGLCISGLMSSGLVNALDTYGGTSYEISELGRVALEVVNQLHEEQIDDG